MCKAFFISFTVAGLAFGDLPDFNAPHHPTQILVRFQSGTSNQSKQTLHQTLGTGPVLREYSILSDLQLVQVPEGSVEDSVMAYLSDPSVLYAEPDYERSLGSVCNPNDPKFSVQWGIAKVRAPEAWCVNPGNQNFLIAVIDSGIGYHDATTDIDHADLAGNMWRNPGECPGGACVANALDDDGNGYIDDFYGWNFETPQSNIASDDFPHGTEVAGVVGAVANNSLGIAGVNWQCKLVALKFNLNPDFVVSSELEALDYCAQNNIKLSNNS
ncbi:MAG: S8 family serine peptidase [Planctomycetes bacterium]|nr:S8 family serine peptidase [Planctomycetota bacterium]MBI3834674.1 S8 family serine peptidase [Planctomycetota bacterium]